jgi:hypothetical protein
MRGTVLSLIYQTSFLDWHRYVREPPPFETANQDITENNASTFTTLAAELSDDDSGEVFSNPWSLLSALQLDISSVFQNNTENVVWGDPSSYIFVMLLCNVTGILQISVYGRIRTLTNIVWDVEYTASPSGINSVRRIPSNSSTTGIASMPLAPIWKSLDDVFERAGAEMNVMATNAEELVNSYAQAVSHIFLAPMSGQSNPRTSLAVQSRNSQIISKVPKAAVWLLIVANLFFILFAIALTILALVFSSPDVHQVYIRLRVAGLMAQLFEGEHAQKQLKDSYNLFREHANGEGDEKVVNRVIVKRSAAGGSELKLLL